MNFLGTIIKDAKSWAAKFEKWLGEIGGSAPTFEKIAAATLTFVGPVLEEILTLTMGAPVGALATAVISKAQSDLAAVGGLLTAIGPTPSVASILNGVVADLQGLLTAANITDPATAQKIDLVLTELEALVEAFPAAAPAAPAVAAASPASSPIPVVPIAPAPDPAPAIVTVPAVIAAIASSGDAGAAPPSEHSGLAPQ